MTVKIIKIIKQLFLHLIAWGLLYILLHALRGKSVFSQSLIYVFGTLTFFSALSSYIHFILFGNFFTERKYELYLLGLVLNLIAISFLYKISSELFSPLNFLDCLVSTVFVNVFAMAFYFLKNGLTQQVHFRNL